MSKTRQLNELFEKWKKHYVEYGIDQKSFTKDGIINEDEYESAPKKVLFIIRETNDFPEGDLRDYLSKGPRYNIFHQLAKWAWGILNGFPDFKIIEQSPEELTATTKKIAVINLKKHTGKEAVDFNLLNAFVFLDHELIKKEISIIAPELIICCNTFVELMWALNITGVKENMSELPSLFNKTYDYEYTGNCAKVIPWPFHPAARGQHLDKYDKLRDFFNSHGLVEKK